MSKQECTVLIEMIERHWHTTDPIPEHALGSYVHELKDVPLAHAVAAVDALAREGRRFKPLAGEIRHKVVELELDPPTWSELLEQVQAHRRWRADHPLPPTCLISNADCHDGWVIGVDKRGFDFATKCGCWEMRADHNRGNILHPLVRMFMQAHSPGVDAALEGDSTADSQTRRKWDEFVTRAMETRTLVGIDAPDLPKIARANGSELPTTLSREIAQVRRALPART